MSSLKKFIHWYFFAPNEPRLIGQIIAWWEIRRIPYNLLIGFVGFVSLILFFIFAEATHKIPPGDDFVEPFAPLFAAIVMNICYTLAEFFEIFFGRTWIYSEDVEPWATALLRVGVIISLLIVLFPSIYWGIYLLLLKTGMAN